ncbi:MAG TPA: TonB-dependent receptor [Nevskia sp.]|nr:TonB-dependent receptor [Nevskia sp.]
MHKPSVLKPRLIAAAAASLFLINAAPALAADEAAAAATTPTDKAADGSTPADPAKLQEVVVTGVARPVNRLDSSVSTSSLDLEAAARVAPRSTAELFRSLPGIRAESSGGEGNANITIRGIPLATGGSKYLQLWEDGLPVLEFGDLNFANADNFIRLDGSVSRVESIRGGSASTFASNSPGGIINFISNTGENEGGSIAQSVGVDYTSYRTDFSYGGKATDTISYHVGGFYRTGEGVRHTGLTGDNGGQIKANITKRLDGGFLRFYFKHLNDRISSYLPSPVTYKGSGEFGGVPGYDASRDTLFSRYQSQIVTYDAFGNRRNRDLTDGIHALVTAYGFEFDKDVGDGWKVNNKFRKSDVGGGFISPFTAGVGNAQTLANGLCDACAGSTVRIGQGPNRGQAYNGLAFQNLLFDTSFKDVGLLVNDLKLSKTFAGITATAGFYYSHQNVSIDWNSWQFLLQTVGRDPVGLAVTAPNGDQIANNQGLYNPGLLSWSWDLNYDTTAPYLNIGGQFGANNEFSWDVSGRFDTIRARGTLYQTSGGTPIDYNGDGTISPGLETVGAAFVGGFDPTGRVNYRADHFEYSLGGAYRIDQRSSAFFRYSVGARFNADRLLQIAGAVNADGSLASTTKGYDTVRQIEGGYKIRARGFTFYPTAFYTITDETNADLTNGQTFLRTYAAYGLELESSYRLPGTGFEIAGNTTYTHAEIDKDRLNPAVVGNRPRRQAELIWTVSPRYRAENWTAGITLQGSTGYFLNDDNQQANALKQQAYTLVNAYAGYNLTQSISISISANNLLDEFVVTEAEEATGAPGSIVRARPLNGRSLLGSIRYDF